MFDASKLLNQMFGAGGANNPLGQIGDQRAIAQVFRAHGEHDIDRHVAVRGAIGRARQRAVQHRDAGGCEGVAARATGSTPVAFLAQI